LEGAIIIKKLFFGIFIFLVLIFQTTSIKASSSILARIGNNYYGTLEEAINAAGPNDIISLTNNISLDKTLNINKTVNINLNNFDIKADEKVFTVQGGTLNLSGKGMVYESKPNYGAINVIGSDDSNNNNYSIVNIGKDVTLEGWSGIFINHNNGTGYGIVANIDGGINSVTDANGITGSGVYVNGNIQHENNAPIINLSNTARISSSGVGIYAAGYATYNIDGAYISGSEAGLGIKSGIFNISNGIIHGSGPDKTPTTGNNNGINPSGAAIQIESNAGYKGNIKININGGTLESENSNAFYEYTVNNTSTKVTDINISGGTFKADNNKNAFRLSDSFKNTHQGFITGGTYSSNPDEYLKNGYSSSINEGSLYEVVEGTISVFAIKNKKNNFIIPIIIFISLCVIIYLNRNKILKLFK